MRKVVIISMLALFSSLVVQAQVKFGLKVGSNVHKVALCDLKNNLDASNRYGFFAGPTVDIGVPFGFGVESSLLYENRKIRITDGEQTDERQFHYVTWPIMLRYSAGLGRVVSLYIGTGPQFTYDVSDRKWDILDRKQLSEGWGLRNAELTWNVGGGITLLRHLRVAYNYNVLLGSKEDGKDGFWIWNDEHAHSNRWQDNAHQISMTYFF